MFEGQVGDVQVKSVTPSSVRISTSHRQIDACHQVLLFDLECHLLGRCRFSRREQAAGVERGELVARRGDDPLDGFGKAAGTDRRRLFPKRTPRRTRS